MLVKATFQAAGRLSRAHPAQEPKRAGERRNRGRLHRARDGREAVEVMHTYCICMCGVASAAIHGAAERRHGTGHMLPNGQPFLLRARGSLTVTGNLAEGRRKRSGANGKPPLAFPCGLQLDSSSSPPEFSGREGPVITSVSPAQ